jgi:hypothetical protein
LRGNKCKQFFSTEEDWHHACLEETHKLLQITLKEVKEDGCPVRVSLHGGTPPFCIVLLLRQLPTIWLHKAAAKTIESSCITAQPLCQQNLTKTETSSTIRNHELEGAHETKHSPVQTVHLEHPRCFANIPAVASHNACQWFPLGHVNGSPFSLGYDAYARHLDNARNRRVCRNHHKRIFMQNDLATNLLSLVATPL